jgi:hypothetical protein
MPLTHPRSQHAFLATSNSISASSQTADFSTNNFSTIFNAASTEYHRVTGKRLDTHPFAALFDTCNTTEAILNIFRTQAQAFSRSRKGDERLMAWLDPMVHILFVFGTLGEGIGLVSLPVHPLRLFPKTWFSAIHTRQNDLYRHRCSSWGESHCESLVRIPLTSSSQAVKDVVASHDTLINLFERIHFFLQRLNSYAGIPLTSGLTELLGMIMAQILSVFALSTKAMTEKRISALTNLLCSHLSDYDTETFLKIQVGRGVEDALLRLDSLTKEESLMAVARNLEATQFVDRIVRSVDSNVKAAKEGMDCFLSPCLR